MNSELLSNYINAKSKLDKWKAKEKDLRIELLTSLFPKAGEGTHNTFVDGLKIKGKFGLNINLNLKKYTELCHQMSDEELNCVIYKPTLSVKNYKSLSDKPLLEECITISPALPTIEIISEDE